jgi:hypothetical protein
MDEVVPLPDGSELRLEACCDPDGTGWLHRARGERPVTVWEATTLAGPGRAGEILQLTEELVRHLGDRAGELETDAPGGAGERRAERLRAAELRLGADLARALQRHARRAAA